MSFISEFNKANEAFGRECGESFEVVKNGTLGIYPAISIDDVTFEAVKMTGGAAADVSVNLFVTKEVVEAAGIEQGTILLVRGRRVRVKPIVDDGDNMLTINCETAGIKIS